jgi:hypothetical protein
LLRQALFVFCLRLQPILVISPLHGVVLVHCCRGPKCCVKSVSAKNGCYASLAALSLRYTHWLAPKDYSNDASQSPTALLAQLEKKILGRVDWNPNPIRLVPRNSSAYNRLKRFKGVPHTTHDCLAEPLAASGLWVVILGYGLLVTSSHKPCVLRTRTGAHVLSLTLELVIQPFPSPLTF